MSSELDLGLSGTAGGFSQGNANMNSNTQMRAQSKRKMKATPRGASFEHGQQHEQAAEEEEQGGGVGDSDEDDTKPVMHMKSLGMAVLGSHRKKVEPEVEVAQATTSSSSNKNKNAFKTAALTSIAAGARRPSADAQDGSGVLKPAQSQEPVLPPPKSTRSRRQASPRGGDSGDTDMAGFPVLRLDQISQVDTEMLERALEEVPELVLGMHEDAKLSGEPVPKLAAYLQKQIDAMNAEVTKRAAEDRVFSILQGSADIFSDYKDILGKPLTFSVEDSLHQLERKRKEKEREREREQQRMLQADAAEVGGTGTTGAIGTLGIAGPAAPVAADLAQDSSTSRPQSDTGPKPVVSRRRGSGARSLSATANRVSSMEGGFADSADSDQQGLGQGQSDGMGIAEAAEANNNDNNSGLSRPAAVSGLDFGSGAGIGAGAAQLTQALPLSTRSDGGSNSMQFMVGGGDGNQGGMSVAQRNRLAMEEDAKQEKRQRQTNSSSRAKVDSNNQNSWGAGANQERALQVVYKNFGSQFVVAATEKKKRRLPPKKVVESVEAVRARERAERRQLAMQRLMDRREKQQKEKMERRERKLLQDPPTKKSAASRVAKVDTDLRSKSAAVVGRVGKTTSGTGNGRTNKSAPVGDGRDDQSEDDESVSGGDDDDETGGYVNPKLVDAVNSAICEAIADNSRSASNSPRRPEKENKKKPFLDSRHVDDTHDNQRQRGGKSPRSISPSHAHSPSSQSKSPSSEKEKETEQHSFSQSPDKGSPEKGVAQSALEAALAKIQQLESELATKGKDGKGSPLRVPTEKSRAIEKGEKHLTATQRLQLQKAQKEESRGGRAGASSVRKDKGSRLPYRPRAVERLQTQHVSKKEGKEEETKTKGSNSSSSNKKENTKAIVPALNLNSGLSEQEEVLLQNAENSTTFQSKLDARQFVAEVVTAALNSPRLSPRRGPEERAQDRENQNERQLELEAIMQPVAQGMAGVSMREMEVRNTMAQDKARIAMSSTPIHDDEETTEEDATASAEGERDLSSLHKHITRHDTHHDHSIHTQEQQEYAPEGQEQEQGMSVPMKSPSKAKLDGIARVKSLAALDTIRSLKMKRQNSNSNNSNKNVEVEVEHTEESKERTIESEAEAEAETDSGRIRNSTSVESEASDIEIQQANQNQSIFSSPISSRPSSRQKQQDAAAEDMAVATDRDRETPSDIEVEGKEEQLELEQEEEEGEEKGGLKLPQMSPRSLRSPAISPRARKPIASKARPKAKREPLAPLVEQRDGVYFCQTGPDELPGLRAWTLDHVQEGDLLEASWSFDMQLYYNISPPTEELLALRSQRAGKS